MRNKDNDKEYHEIINNTVLPQWLIDELPAKKPLNTMAWSDEHQGFYIEEESSPTYYSNAYDLYSNIQRNSGVDFAINNNIGGKNGVELVMDGMASYNNNLFLSSTDSDHENILKFSYHTWINEIHPNYLKDPRDWVAAYQWIERHPIFWIHNYHTKTFHWLTSNGTDNIYTMVGVQNGSPYVALECGEHTDDYTQHYHNIDLDTYGENFEDAYIKLANRINQLFTADGYPRS